MAVRNAPAATRSGTDDADALLLHLAAAAGASGFAAYDRALRRNAGRMSVEMASP